MLKGVVSVLSNLTNPTSQVGISSVSKQIQTFLQRWQMCDCQPCSSKQACQTHFSSWANRDILFIYLFIRFQKSWYSNNFKTAMPLNSFLSFTNGILGTLYARGPTFSFFLDKQGWQIVSDSGANFLKKAGVVRVMTSTDQWLTSNKKIINYNRV